MSDHTLRRTGHWLAAGGRSRHTSGARAGDAVPVSGAGSMRAWLLAFGRAVVAALAFPVAVLLHELGHFAAYLVFGFSGVVLSFASVGWQGRHEFWRLVEAGDLAGAAAFAEPWQVAIGVAAGPVMTYITLVACILVARRYRAPALVLAIGLITPLRWLPAGVILVHRLLGRTMFGSGTDEGRLALLGFPEPLLLLLGLVGLIGGWTLLVRAVPRGSRTRRLAPVLAGIVAGGFAWARWLGPLLLP